MQEGQRKSIELVGQEINSWCFQIVEAREFVGRGIQSV